MRLEEPSMPMEKAFKCMAKDYQEHGEERYKIALEDKFDFFEYIQKLQSQKSIAQNTESAPSTTFWLVNDNKILGVSRLRHYLVPQSVKEGGHIGYDVPPSFRQNGYATLLLKLTLEKAKGLGLQRALVTCDSDNIASSKVITKNGGVFENEVISEKSGKKVSRYWIEL